MHVRQSKGSPLVSILLPLRMRVLQEQIHGWDFGPADGKSELIYYLHTDPKLNEEQIQERPTAKWSDAPFADASRQAAEKATGKYFLFLDTEVVASRDWLRHLVVLLERDPMVGAVGPVRIRNGNADTAGLRWNRRRMGFTPIPLPNARGPVEADFIGGPVLIRADLFRALGFDRNLRWRPLMEWDFLLRARALGYRVMAEAKSRSSSPSRFASPTPLMLRSRIFRDRWIRSGELLRALRTDLNRNWHLRHRMVVYTAITNNYDSLKEQPEVARAGVDFVAFLDGATRRHNRKSKAWEIRPFDQTSEDPNRTAKRCKILPHLYFRDHRYSLWIDGSVSLCCPFPIDRLVALYLRDVDFCILRHSRRSCTYQEATACIARGLDDPNVIREQVRRYRRQGLPSRAGLAEATVILRRHTVAVRRFCEAWWEEIRKGSRRDQLSFIPTARKLRFRFHFFPLDIEESAGLFVKHRHAR